MTDTIKTIKENTKKLLKMGADELMDELHMFREIEKIEESAFKPDANGYSPGDTVSVKIRFGEDKGCESGTGFEICVRCD